MKDKQLILATLAQLEREKTVSIPQLAQLLGASEEDVYAALEILVFAYDAASIRLDLHDTYAALETHGTDRLLRLTPVEAEVLVDALMSAGFSQDDDLVRALLEAKSVFDGHGEPSSPRVQTIGAQDSSTIAQTVARACEDDGHRLLEIAYRGEDDDTARTRCVEPAGIFSREGHRYLQAFCHEAHGWRSFRLDRIEGARTLEEHFTPRDDAPAIGNAFKGDSIRARIWIDADSDIPQWRGKRVAQTLEDGSRIVTIPWTGSSWLPRHVVALMGKAIPLEPPELIEACRDVAEGLLEQ